MPVLFNYWCTAYNWLYAQKSGGAVIHAFFAVFDGEFFIHTHVLMHVIFIIGTAHIVFGAGSMKL